MLTIGQKVRHAMHPGYGHVTAITETNVYVAWDCGVTIAHPASTRALRAVKSVQTAVTVHKGETILVDAPAPQEPATGHETQRLFTPVDVMTGQLGFGL